MHNVHPSNSKGNIKYKSERMMYKKSTHEDFVSA